MSVENVDLHETVQRQAVTDELTGLFNHRRFQEVMDVEVERARRYDAEMGLIMLDIDNFKRVNDTYGHMQGDEVLRAVARVLQAVGARDRRARPLRRRGDGRRAAADRSRRRVPLRRARPQAHRGARAPAARRRRISPSYRIFWRGLAQSSAAQSDKEGLVAAADAALYRAKRSGKNRTVKAE